MDDLLATIEKLQTPSAGAHIVAVSTRDSLGWPTRARTAAAGAALTAAARSLALQLAPQRITVNLVAALPPATSPLRDTLPAQATCLSEPAELTGDAITIDDIADNGGVLPPPPQSLHHRTGPLRLRRRQPAVQPVRLNQEHT